MLLSIKKLLNERGRMSLAELAVHFGSDPSAVEPMMHTLVESGAVRRIDAWKETGCAGCPGCAHIRREDFILYEWA